MSKISTKQRALIIGEKLLQSHGYDGFSFQDIADELKIRKASLYDHFASKEELGNSIINNYRDQLTTWSKNLTEYSPQDQVLELFILFFEFAKENRFCPITALAGNLQDLPESLRNNTL